MSVPKTPHEFLAKAPGICGQIARHIYDGLQWDQPMLALGAAISFVGFLKSKRYSTQDHIPAHVFCALIADSGTGKSQCQEAIQKIIFDAGLDSCLMGKPKSDSALLHALEKSPEARKYLVWDEFGIGLGALSKSSTAHQKMILSTMLDLFSCGNKKYIGDEYAKATKQERVDLISPTLSILGASTPDRFYDALSEQFVLDGTLSRFLLFFGVDAPEGKQATHSKIPLRTITDIQKINEGQHDFEAGDIGSLVYPKINIINFSKNALDAYEELSDHCKSLVTNASDKIERVFLTRLYEQIIKLVIIFSSDDTCDDFNFIYSIKLAKFLVNQSASRCKSNLFDSQVQKLENKLRDKVLEFFKKPGETKTRTEIYKFLKSCRSQDLNVVLESLVDSGDLAVEYSKGNGRALRTYIRLG